MASLICRNHFLAFFLQTLKLAPAALVLICHDYTSHGADLAMHKQSVTYLYTEHNKLGAAFKLPLGDRCISEQHAHEARKDEHTVLHILHPADNAESTRRRRQQCTCTCRSALKKSST